MTGIIICKLNMYTITLRHSRYFVLLRFLLISTENYKRSFIIFILLILEIYAIYIQFIDA